MAVATETDLVDRALGRLVMQRDVHVEDVALAVTHPVENVFLRHVLSGAHARKAMPKRVQFVSLPILKPDLLAQLLQGLEQQRLVKLPCAEGPLLCPWVGE